MAGGLIGKAAKLVKGKKKPNKKTRTARNKRKNLVKDMKAEDRAFGDPHRESPYWTAKRKPVKKRASKGKKPTKKQEKELYGDTDIPF